jgi:hypothetical protein
VLIDETSKGLPAGVGRIVNYEVVNRRECVVRGQNVDLQNPDIFRVTDRRPNTAKKAATTPKRRAIVEAFHTWFCRSTF